MIPHALNRLALFSLVLFSAVLAGSGAAAQTTPPSLSGAWTLNPALTKAPAEIGFNTNLVPEPDDSDRFRSEPGRRSCISRHLGFCNREGSKCNVCVA